MSAALQGEVGYALLQWFAYHNPYSMELAWINDFIAPVNPRITYKLKGQSVHPMDGVSEAMSRKFSAGHAFPLAAAVARLKHASVHIGHHLSPTGTQTYTAHMGDTFASISRRFYGTPAYAEVIQRANPEAPRGKVLAGEVYVIPEVTQREDDTATHELWQTVLAKVMPKIMPQGYVAPKKLSCIDRAEEFAVVLAIGFVMPMLLTSGAGFWMMALAGGIGNAIASVVTEVMTDDDLGQPVHISLKEVMVSFVTGAIPSGVHALKVFQDAGWLKRMVLAASANLTTQGIVMKAENIPHLDWGELVSAGLSGAVDNHISDETHVWNGVKAAEEEVVSVGSAAIIDQHPLTYQVVLMQYLQDFEGLEMSEYESRRRQYRSASYSAPGHNTASETHHPIHGSAVNPHLGTSSRREALSRNASTVSQYSRGDRAKLLNGTALEHDAKRVAFLAGVATKYVGTSPAAKGAAGEARVHAGINLSALRQARDNSFSHSVDGYLLKEVFSVLPASMQHSILMHGGWFRSVAQDIQAAAGVADSMRTDAEALFVSPLVEGSDQVMYGHTFGARAMGLLNLSVGVAGFMAPQITDAAGVVLRGSYDLAQSTVATFGRTVERTAANQAGLFGERSGLGAERLPLFKTGPVTPEEANLPFLQKGMRPPYGVSVRPRIIQLPPQGKVLLRVYDDQKFIAGQWMLRPKEIEGLTPEQIQDKFALPTTPTKVAEVHLPGDWYLQIGRAAEQEDWGAGGAFQYQSLGRLPRDYFQNPMPIEEYLNQVTRRPQL